MGTNVQSNGFLQPLLQLPPRRRRGFRVPTPASSSRIRQAELHYVGPNPISTCPMSLNNKLQTPKSRKKSNPISAARRQPLRRQPAPLSSRTVKRAVKFIMAVAIADFVFVLNGATVPVNGIDPQITLLDFVRSQGLTG